MKNVSKKKSVQAPKGASTKPIAPPKVMPPPKSYTVQLDGEMAGLFDQMTATYGIPAERLPAAEPGWS